MLADVLICIIHVGTRALVLFVRYVDLQLPELEAKVEHKTVVISEPKIKFKEKKVDSLGADLIAFKKRKQAARSIKQRETDS